MKALFKKTFKITTSGIIIYKGSQYMLNNIHRNQKIAEASEVVSSDDLLGSIIRNEFTGDISQTPYEQKAVFDFKLKSRKEHMEQLTKKDAKFDLLVVGGGSSGAGVALEASSRGLSCAVIDSFDFASGTSSRSTKMAHGGLRYFE